MTHETATWIDISRVYTTRELGDLLGMAQTHICKLCQREELPGVYKDERGRYRIPGIAVTNWLRAHMPCAQAPSRWLTPWEMAEHCDVSANAIRRWCRDGEVPNLADGTSGVKRVRYGRKSVWLVHGDALRGVMSFRGRARVRPKVRPKEDDNG